MEGLPQIIHALDVPLLKMLQSARDTGLLQLSIASMYVRAVILIP